MITPMASPRPGTLRTPRWTRLDHAERRRQILSCARRLFSERRYEAVSTGEIAQEAGVTRGLIYHYFGDKRGLYVEVVRSLFALPPDLFVTAPGRDREAALYDACDRWLAMAVRNRATVIAVAGAQGFGRDPELEEIADDMRQRTADGVIGLLTPGDAASASPELRALVIAYAAFVQVATVNWLERDQPSRAQLREMLVQGILALQREVLPRLEKRAAHSAAAIG